MIISYSISVKLKKSKMDKSRMHDYSKITGEEKKNVKDGPRLSTGRKRLRLQKQNEDEKEDPVDDAKQMVFKQKKGRSDADIMYDL